MAVQIEVNYSKKLGLPGYSSHQFAITVRKEITDVAQVEKEGSQLYRLLQDSVDREIQEAGYVPALDAPVQAPVAAANGTWQCSDKQRQLIEDVMHKHDYSRDELDALARERFGKPVPSLNKLEASGLIDELFERVGHPGRKPQMPRRNGRQPAPEGAR